MDLGCARDPETPGSFFPTILGLKCPIEKQYIRDGRNRKDRLKDSSPWRARSKRIGICQPIPELANNSKFVDSKDRFPDCPSVSVCEQTKGGLL
jgi:hypothetical protein